MCNKQVYDKKNSFDDRESHRLLSFRIVITLIKINYRTVMLLVIRELSGGDDFSARTHKRKELTKKKKTPILWHLFVC